MKFGLIGAGRWAEVHKAALETLGVELAAVLVSSDASVQRVESDWGVAATNDLAAFLSVNTDAVIVASPNYLHAEHAVACLDAGRHVLVEKPLAITLAGCDAILAAAQRSGKIAAVGLEMRVFKLFAKVKELIATGAIGTPRHLKLDLWRRPYRGGAGGWKADPAKLGSSILEEPVHYLDLARWYLTDALGEPTSVRAWANSRAHNDNRDDRSDNSNDNDQPDSNDESWENLDILLELTGARAWVTRSIAAYGHHVYLELVGDSGSLRASWEGREDMDREPRQQLWLHDGTDRDAYAQAVSVPLGGHAFDLAKQTAAFISAIADGAAPAASAVDGRASVALCLAAEASLRSGGVVKL